VTTSAAPVSPATADEQGFSLRQRIVLALVSTVGYLAIRLIGPTLRFTVSIEEGGPPAEHVHPAIYVFWHRCVFPATWFFRHRNIAVMTSKSFDGEYIARIIEMFGFPAVRGSSSRGGVRALLGMHKILDKNASVAFTIDGPRGPRYVAKPGPVLLARNTGAPIMCFHIALEKAWILKSWDRFMIPKPFSRAFLRIGSLMHIPADLDSNGVAAAHADMQATLDRIREFAEHELPGTEIEESGE
jgi:lysophospholipid acyltransferase (LPLAT)-like uncharacterized protein